MEQKTRKKIKKKCALLEAIGFRSNAERKPILQKKDAQAPAKNSTSLRVRERARQREQKLNSLNMCARVTVRRRMMMMMMMMKRGERGERTKSRRRKNGAGPNTTIFKSDGKTQFCMCACVRRRKTPTKRRKME